MHVISLFSFPADSSQSELGTNNITLKAQRNKAQLFFQQVTSKITAQNDQFNFFNF